MRLLNTSALVCAALSLVLMGVRMSGAISLSEPLHVVTSGWEQESLIAFWDYLHDKAIYVSRWEIPYRWAIYNWLYYISYASAIEALSSLLSLDAMWWPTIGRMITIGVMVMGMIGAYVSYGAVLGPLKRDEKTLGVAFATLVAAGPLVGFWAITSRPDLMAMTLEIWAVFIFWRFYGQRPLLSVLLFCVVAYAAWAFKQSYVNAVGAVGLFLLFRRQWKLLAILCVIMIGTWSLTLLMGSSAYVASMVQTEFKWTASLNHAVAVIWVYVKKAIPALVSVVALGVMAGASKPLRQRFLKNDAFLFALGGCSISLMLALATIPQPGSADHYFFTFTYFLTLAFLAGLRIIRAENPVPKQVLWACTAGWTLQSLAIVAVLAGFAGTTSVRFHHANFVESKKCLDPLPRPLFVQDHYLSLPWMTPGNPSFVLAYGYKIDSQEGRRSMRERGGIGGLIKEKYFKALALSVGTENTFDGASLDGYQKIESSCPGHIVLMAKPDTKDQSILK